MMYQLDSRWRRESLVYFGEPQDSSANVAGGAFREARGYVPGPRYSEIFDLGERPGCILNLGHSFDAIEAYP